MSSSGSIGEKVEHAHHHVSASSRWSVSRAFFQTFVGFILNLDILSFSGKKVMKVKARDSRKRTIVMTLRRRNRTPRNARNQGARTPFAFPIRCRPFASRLETTRLWTRRLRSLSFLDLVQTELSSEPDVYGTSSVTHFVSTT